MKAIKLPPLFFGPPPDKKDNGPPDSLENLNKSSLPTRRPLITPLNRRVQQIRKRAILLRKKPTRGEMMRGQRGMPLLEDPTMGRRPLLGNRMPDPRMLPDPMRNRGMGKLSMLYSKLDITLFDTKLFSLLRFLSEGPFFMTIFLCILDSQ